MIDKSSSVFAVLLAAAMTGTAFGGNKTGWQASFDNGAFSFKDMAFEKLNLGHRFRRTADGGAYSQNAPWTRGDADAKNISHMQFRVWNAPGAWMAVDFLGHRIMEPTAMGFGFFTVPVYGPWTKFPTDAQDGVAPVVGHIGGTGDFVDMSEVLLVGDRAIDGVYVSAKRKDGTPVLPGETAKSGDLLTVTMPVISRPDSLRLFFKELSDDPAKCGNRLSIPLDNAPPRLEPSAEDPLLYTATFELPVLQKERKVRLGGFVAMIDYAGVDSRIWGPYYGVAPFAVDFAGGSTEGYPPPDFAAFDFGPAGQAVLPGAKAVSPDETPEGFRWISKPSGYDDSKHKYLDPLALDWAFVQAGETAEFAVTVPRKGRYAVTVGLWMQGALCYRNQDYRPLEYDIYVNEKLAGSRRRGTKEDETSPLMDREAEADEDVYETYLKKGTCFQDIEFETEAEGEVTVKVVAPKTEPKSTRRVPVNYVFVRPCGDAASESYRKWLDGLRRKRFYGYWADATQSIPDARNALAVQEIPGSGLRLFARANALDWVLRDTKPLVNEIGRPLVVKAARGERISGGVLLNASEDVAGISFAVEGLPEKAHPRILKQMVYRFTHPWNAIHQLGVNHLLPATARDAKAGESYGYLVRFDVDEDLAPGFYPGKFVATAADGRRAELPVELTVRACTLPKLSDHLITMINGSRDREGMEFCKNELGATSFLIANTRPQWLRFEYDKDGHPVALKGNVDYPDPLAVWDKAFADFKEVGFDCPYPMFALMGVGYNEAQPFDNGRIKALGFGPDYRAAIRLTYGKIKELAQKHGLPNVIFDMGGEMGHEAKKPADFTVQNAIALYKAIHEEVPGSMLSYRCNCFTTVDEFFPYLEVQGVRGKTSWLHADKITDCGRNKWIYSYSTENRFNNGIRSWAHGARGNFREWLTWDHVENFNDFLCQGSCGGTAHFETIPGPDGKLVPTLRSEAFRASVFDRKFLRLLENAMKSPMAKADEKAKAESFRQLVRRIVYDHASDEGSGWSYGTHRNDGNNPWPGLRLDLMRDLCEQFAAALETGKTSGLPDLAPAACDYTAFGLTDGPIEPAGQPLLAAFANEKVYDLSDLARVRVELYNAVGGRVGSFAAGPKDRCLHPSFTIPSADLKAGKYVLKLVIGGDVKAESAFHLLAQ